MRNIPILFCILLLTLSACMPSNAVGSTASTAEAAVTETAETAVSVEPTVPEHLTTQVGNFTLQLDAPAADALEALGKPNSVTEEPSCAFDGMERNYIYDALHLRTYTVDDGEERIFGWWIEEGTLETGEGIGIGSTREQVAAAYGSFEDNSCQVKSGSESLIILLNEDLVYCIQYGLQW